MSGSGGRWSEEQLRDFLDAQDVMHSDCGTHGRGLQRLFAHKVPVYPYTLAASGCVVSLLFAHSALVHRCRGPDTAFPALPVCTTHAIASGGYVREH